MINISIGITLVLIKLNNVSILNAVFVYDLYVYI